MVVDFGRGESIAVYGDNGTGKSTIADALEWYFTGEIELLCHEGRQHAVRHVGGERNDPTTVEVVTNGVLGGTAVFPEERAIESLQATLAGEQAHIRVAPLQLVWLADLARLEHIASQLQRPSTGLDYLEMLLVGVVDAALAAQNAMVAAESLGLGAVYIGAMRNRPLEVARLLELPPRVVAVSCVRTAASHPPTSGRSTARSAACASSAADPTLAHVPLYDYDCAACGWRFEVIEAAATELGCTSAGSSRTRVLISETGMNLRLRVRAIRARRNIAATHLVAR